eukprot:scaffold3020_cov118-Cylindrotheca_fusiformis.AAC.2
MKFVGLISGGKDSIYSILESMRNGHELVAVVHLGAPPSIDEESYMYQTAASEVIKTLVEDCLQVPLILHQRAGQSINTSLVYENENQRDEVEDLTLALTEARKQFDFAGVSSGALFSTYQRVRIESVCRRLDLTSLSYLWRLLPQKEMLQKMLEDGIEAVLVRTASPPGLLPEKHLNKTLSSLWHSGLLERLNQRYQFQLCGEGGEYESLVVDSPLHKKKLVLDETRIEATGDEVGVLRILRCHAADKDKNDVPVYKNTYEVHHGTGTREKKDVSDHCSFPPQNQSVIAVTLLPSVKETTGHLLHVSEIMSPSSAAPTGLPKAEVQLAVEEARHIFATLRESLFSCDATATDVVFVHIYLSEMSHFAAINAHYQEFFGSLLPPSRSCVGVGTGVLPGGRRVLLDCMIQKGSGAYMRSSKTSPLAMAARFNVASKLREVLHVQSISNWAPVCVGPYSQSNTLRSSFHFLAGQIGLIPSSMQLHSTWTLQLQQCWRNTASVLDALNGASLALLFSGLVYVDTDIYHQPSTLDELERITKAEIRGNGAVIPGRIDSTRHDQYGGYEDEGTMQELEREEVDKVSPCPILIVAIPEMPKKAAVEVEVVTVTTDVASSLEISDFHIAQKCGGSARDDTVARWDTGHTFSFPSRSSNQSIEIDVFGKIVGHGCAASTLVLASTSTSATSIQLQPVSLLFDMLSAHEKLLAKARSGLCNRSVLHLRLYYQPGVALDDGVQWRTSLQSAVALWCDSSGLFPATTVVPVQGISLINTESVSKESSYFLAMQCLVVDPVHMETERFVHNVNGDDFF